MGQADFVLGNPTMVDHTPSGADVAAGQVIVNDTTPMVAHNKIVDGRLGSLSIGGGVYKVTAAGSYVVGDLVYWDDSADKVTTSASGNMIFGKMAEASTGDGDTALAYHMPIALAVGS